jgi:hypothetical protein
MEINEIRKLSRQLGIPEKDIVKALEKNEIEETEVILITEYGTPVMVISDIETISLDKLSMRRRLNPELEYYGFSYRQAGNLPRNSKALMALFATLSEERRNLFFMKI